MWLASLLGVAVFWWLLAGLGHIFIIRATLGLLSLLSQQRCHTYNPTLFYPSVLYRSRPGYILYIGTLYPIVSWVVWTVLLCLVTQGVD